MRCGETEGQIHVDHIEPWIDSPELRYNLGNLQLLAVLATSRKQVSRISIGYGNHPSL
jgi:hypothetical protein